MLDVHVTLGVECGCFSFASTFIAVMSICHKLYRVYVCALSSNWRHLWDFGCLAGLAFQRLLLATACVYVCGFLYRCCVPMWLHADIAR